MLAVVVLRIDFEDLDDERLDILNPNIQRDLVIDGEIVGKFRVLKLPSIPYRILMAFQAVGWQAVIDDPLGGDAKDLQDGVGYLNQQVAGVRFHTHRSGGAISWERC